MWLFQKYLALFLKLELTEKRLRKLVLFLFDIFIMLVYGVGESNLKDICVSMTLRFDKTKIL